MKRRNRATRRRKMRGGMNIEGLAPPSNEERREKEFKDYLEKQNNLLIDKSQLIQKKHTELKEFNNKDDVINVKAFDNEVGNTIDELLNYCDEEQKKLDAKITEMEAKISKSEFESKEQVDEYTQDESFKSLLNDEFEQKNQEFEKLKKEVNLKIKAEKEAEEKKARAEGDTQGLATKETGVTVEEAKQRKENSQLPPPLSARKYNNDVVPILDEIKDENVSQAIETSLPYFEADKDRLESGQISVNQKSESPEKTEILKHINQEKAIVEGKIADLKTKSKVVNIKALIDQEVIDRKVRKETEQKLLKLLDKVTAGNPELGEKKERKQMGNENTNAPEAIKKQLVEARKNAIHARNQATGQEEGNKNNVRYDPTDPDLVSIFGDGNNEQVPQRRETASAESQTPQPSGVTVKNVEMVCNNLKNEIAALEEQIAKLQGSNTGTSTQSRGGRKSRNNKKKKKSKAKKNKTRRRRRSKA